MIILEEETLLKQSVVDFKKNQKQRAVLSCLYQEGACTLAHLAQVVHTSIPSVTGLVEQLVDQGWINTTGTATRHSGRRPVLFGLRPDRHYVVLVDSSTHDTSLVLVNPLRQVVYRRTVDHGLQDHAQFVTSLVEFIKESLINSAVAPSDVIAFGLAIPGLIDNRQGLNLTYPNLNPPGESLATYLERQLDLPVFIINDTKATALGEHRFGGGRDKQHALSINIDWGVGLGIILNGEVFQGASGFAGELGHIQVDPEGELCYCGKVGCLDTLTSASSLVRRVREAVLGGAVSQLALHQADVDQLTIGHVVEAAHQGDAFAIDMLHQTGYQLGKGLAIAINLF
ncbi:MAG: ROK family protein, partial [Cytophagaceae bacterium]